MRVRLGVYADTSKKGLKTRLCPPEDEGVNIVCALVGINCFKIDHVAHDLEFIGNAVAAVHVARRAGHVQRLAAE